MLEVWLFEQEWKSRELRMQNQSLKAINTTFFVNL